MAATEIATHWRLNAQRYRMQGEICPNPKCNIVIFPPRDVCPDCHENTMDEEGKPKITIIYDSSSARIATNG